MKEKRYLNFGQILGYGMGSIGTNFCYTFVSSFVLIYLTNIVGLNSGIVGTLMLVSKVFDGVTDVLFGTVIDRTKTRLGKARPWLIGSIIPLGLCTFLEFAVPAGNQTMQYVYFFVVYTLMNAVFYTIMDIAYSTLVALATKNKNEQVQMGVSRFVLAMVGAMLISTVTTVLVSSFGGDAAAWRMVALIYAVALVVMQGITALTVKELPADELYEESAADVQKPVSFWKTLTFLFTNKYFLLILGIYIFNQMMNAISQSVGIYYVSYILGDANMFGIFSIAGMLPMVIGLFLTPPFVKKYGIYKTNLISLAIAIIVGIPYIILGMKKMVIVMLVLLAIRGLFTSPITGTLSALTAEASRNAFLKTGNRLEGSMFACSSMGAKVGSGIGLAVGGWLLSISGYDGLAAVQPQSALNMITVMYIVLPVVSILLQMLCMSGLKVEKENAALEAANKEQ